MSVLINWLSELISKIVNFFSQKRLITKQLNFLLYCSRIFNSLKFTYSNEYYLSRALVLSNRTGNSNINLHAQCSEDSIKGEEQTNSSKTGFRRMSRVWIVLERISTIYMTYIVLRHLLPLEWLINWIFEPKLPANCYILGRLVLFKPLAKPLAILVAAYHLAWRFSVQFLSRTHKLSLIPFMLQQDEDIERQYKEIGSDFESYKSIQISPANNDDIQKKAQDVYIRSLMYYSVKFPNSYINYRLRPNRTASSRRLLAREISITFLAALSIFCVLFIITCPMIFIRIFSDLHCLDLYEKCYPNLEKLFLERANKTRERSIYIIGNGRFISLLFDFVENVSLWTDSGISITLVCALGLILNNDLIVYWRHVHERLDNLLYKLKLIQITRSSKSAAILHHECSANHNYDCAYNCAINYRQKTNVNHFIAQQRMRFSKFPYLTVVQSKEKSTTNDSEDELDVLVFDLQEMLADFFNQIRNYDSFISDLITSIVIIWLSSFAILSYFSAIKVLDDSGYVIRLIQVLGFISFSVSTLVLLTLHHCTMRSYTKICAIMALDRSMYKLRFITILNYYSRKSRSFYTVAHSYPFTGTTFLSIIGWTLSSAIILENLFSY